MQPFPHRYDASALATETGNIELGSKGLHPLVSAAPIEFDGPGTEWSPETLLVAAVADCFALTFRSVARASKIGWSSLRCDAAGTLARVDSVTRFTSFAVHAQLSVPPSTDPVQARLALERTERLCLVTNSLNAPIDLTTEIEIAAPSLVGVP